MKKPVFAVILAVVGVLGTTLWAADENKVKEEDRIQAATDVLNDIVKAPDKGIPEDILAKAKCVAVVPSLKKGGFIFGAQYGKGLASCRAAHGWSAPAPIKIVGGSWGAQIGGEAVDLIMLIMNDRGTQHLLESKFKIGADVAGAAGPIGRDAAANTDWKMRAEVLTYSRSRGLFAGITLDGAAITQDKDDTEALYGKPEDFRQILTGTVRAPAVARPFMHAVARDFREARTAEHEKTASSSGASGSGGVTGALAANGQESKSAPPRSVGSSAQDRSASDPDKATPVSDADQVQEDLSSALKSQLGNDANGIVVGVTAKTIQLSGNVPTSDEREKALRIAQEKAGDRHVDASGLKVR